MKNLFFFIVIILVPLSAYGLGRSCEVDSRSQPVTVNQADSGRTIHLRQNQILTVCLRGNRTTGYSWEVVHASKLTQLGEPEVLADSGALGSGGTYRYSFRAASSGTGNLKMMYRRPWETGIGPLKSFEIFVVVTD